MPASIPRPQHLLACLVLALAPAMDAAETPALGDAAFRPSPERPIGWRGDGTGVYPGARPPLTWGVHLRQLADLRNAAEPVGEGAAAQAVSGTFGRWLVAGPVPCPDPAADLKKPAAEDGALVGKAGEQLRGATWKAVETPADLLDLMTSAGTIGKQEAAFAQTCLHVERETAVWLHLVHVRGLALWLNGNLAYSGPESMTPTLRLVLAPGWNRLLVKLTSAGTDKPKEPTHCQLRARFWPAEGQRACESRNIRWTARMPGLGQAMPVVVGDRVFATAHPHSLVCLDKASGRVVWIRQVSPYDAATAEERSAKPEAFARLDALAAKRKAYYDAFIAGEAPGEAQVKEEAALEDLMDKTMLEVDPEKYKRPDEQGEPDWWLVPTPVSDGSGIYLASTRGTCAGFALDGTRRWIRYQRPLNQHHGFFASPVIADGKLIALDGTLTAYDTASGATAWSLDLVKDKIKGYLWFGSLLRGDLGGTSYVLCPNGTTLVRARDGRVTGGPSLISSTTTPVFDGTTSWQLAEVSLLAHPLAATADGVAVGKPRHLPAAESERLGSGTETVSIGGIIRRQFAKSPLVHDGLVYALTNHDELLVMEADTGRLAYRTLLPLELWNGSRRVGYHFSVANLAMAGGHLFVCGASGQTLVIKAGRTYQEVARNRIQNLARSGRVLGNYGYASTNRPLCPDYFDGTANTTPVFDGPRILLRSDESIYCIQAAGD